MNARERMQRILDVTEAIGGGVRVCFVVTKLPGAGSFSFTAHAQDPDTGEKLWEIPVSGGGNVTLLGGDVLTVTIDEPLPVRMT